MTNKNDVNDLAAGKLSYTVEEACKVTGIGRTTLWLRVKANKIAIKKEGGRTIILRSELERYLNDLPDGEVVPRAKSA